MILDGKKISKEIKDEVKEKVSLMETKPRLAVVLVGDDGGSAVYVRNKKRACEYVGIDSVNYELPAETTEEELLELVNKLNNDGSVNGILVQLPLPSHIDENKVIYAVDYKKDVDCFHPYNVGLGSIGEGVLLPCTPSGIIQLIKRHNIEIQGKNCVVIGRSNIVGKPMASMLLKENGTVTIAHSKTKNLKEICKSADILVVAIGRQKFVNSEYVKDGATVLDVGIHRLDDGKLCGDVDFDDVESKAAYITPVPGGVGVMTIAMLMENCVKAYEMQKGK